MTSGMRREDIRALFHAGTPADGKDFDRAMSEAESRPSGSAVFRSTGREFLLLRSLDDGSWGYRPMREGE
jgi:hypothetical protein